MPRAGICLLLGEAGPEAEAGLLLTGAGPLAAGPQGSQGYACALVCGARSWALRWAGHCPGVAVALACGAVWPVASQSWCPQAGG